MRNKNLSIKLVVLALILSLQASAQESPTEMADMMRSNGKIYVVVAVLSTILAGLILYLISLDRRIRRMERESE
jgi:ABC-type spermidine/putrescine transport system permease subunit II